MTDLELFCDMLSRAGVQFQKTDAGNFYADVEGTVTAVELSAKSDHVYGYDSFTTHFTFDKETGALNSVYIWE